MVVGHENERGGKTFASIMHAPCGDDVTIHLSLPETRLAGLRTIKWRIFWMHVL